MTDTNGRSLKLIIRDKSPDDCDAFRNKIVAFYRELQRLAADTRFCNSAWCDLNATEVWLYDQFGLTSQALRICSEYATKYNYPPDHVQKILAGFCETLQAAIYGHWPGESANSRVFFDVHPKMGRALLFSADPLARSLEIGDHVEWWKLIHGDSQGAWIGAQERDQPRPDIVIGSTATPEAEPKTEARPTRPELRPTKSQELAIQTLGAFHFLKQTGAHVAGYDLRLHPLIIGPSGSGKTAVVKAFCNKQSIPMLSLNCGSWIVAGASAKEITSDLILRFVREYSHGVIFIDEIDKTYGEGFWVRSLQQEIYSLLDGRTDCFTGWDAVDRERLAESYLIVGAGTWQHLYAGKQKALGFGASSGNDPWEIDVWAQTSIPEELLNRFNADAIFIDPPDAGEFKERIIEIRNALGRRPLEEAELDQLAADALASGLHNRWLETYASRLRIAPFLHTEDFEDRIIDLPDPRF